MTLKIESLDIDKGTLLGLSHLYLDTVRKASVYATGGPVEQEGVGVVLPAIYHENHDLVIGTEDDLGGSGIHRRVLQKNGIQARSTDRGFVSGYVVEVKPTESTSYFFFHSVQAHHIRKEGIRKLWDEGIILVGNRLCLSLILFSDSDI
jgi:hypothetical protein